MLNHFKSLLRLKPKWHKRRARLSTTHAVSEGSGVSSGLTSHQIVSRNGPLDSIITLNVGGKEFKTLQSTIQASPVLCETIEKASANGEFVDHKAVFVDRDPTHFPLILTYLRNKAEGIAYNDRTVKKSMMGVTKFVTQKTAKHPKYVRLPENQGDLQDLYVEAVHYGLGDLQHQLCHTSFMVTLASWLGGGGNPFLQANEALKSLRRTFFAFAGTTSIFAAMQAEVNWVKKKLGLPVDETNDSKSTNGEKSGPILAS
jgi:hypothetical protein